MYVKIHKTVFFFGVKHKFRLHLEHATVVIPVLQFRHLFFSTNFGKWLVWLYLTSSGGLGATGLLIFITLGDNRVGRPLRLMLYITFAIFKQNSFRDKCFSFTSLFIRLKSRLYKIQLLLLKLRKHTHIIPICVFYSRCDILQSAYQQDLPHPYAGYIALWSEETECQS